MHRSDKNINESFIHIKIVLEEIKKVMDLPDLKRGEEVKSVEFYDVEFKNVVFTYGG